MAYLALQLQMNLHVPVLPQTLCWKVLALERPRNWSLWKWWWRRRKRKKTTSLTSMYHRLSIFLGCSSSNSWSVLLERMGYFCFNGIYVTNERSKMQKKKIFVHVVFIVCVGGWVCVCAWCVSFLCVCLCACYIDKVLCCNLCLTLARRAHGQLTCQSMKMLLSLFTFHSLMNLKNGSRLSKLYESVAEVVIMQHLSYCSIYRVPNWL